MPIEMERVSANFYKHMKKPVQFVVQIVEHLLLSMSGYGGFGWLGAEQSSGKLSRWTVVGPPSRLFCIGFTFLTRAW